jgi:phosphatidylinositol alpha-1,6-mannosyltransferase
MKKTLLVTLDFPPMVGGVARYYERMVEHLSADRIHVLDNGQNALLATDSLFLPRWLRGIWATYRSVRKQGIEHLLVGQILPIGTIALLLHRLVGIPYTVMTHAMDVTIPFGPQGSPRKQWLVKKILARADSVVTVSRYTQSKLEDIGVPSEKIVLAHPCVDTVVKKQQTEESVALDDNPMITSGDQIILSVGRLVERKGFDRLIEAMRLVHKNHPDAKLVIIGEGSDAKRLSVKIADADAQEYVSLIGATTPEDLRQWYRHCTVFAMPSRELANGDAEGFGIVFLEAAAHGKPAIGGNSGGIPDAIVHEKTGYLVDPENPQDIAEKIIQVLDNPQLAQELGTAGRRRVETEFQWKQQVQKIETLLS